MTDHCAIDRDQAAIEAQLAIGTNESFENALKIYKEGGNSKSYALVTLSPALTASIEKGASIMGKNANGNEVSGKAYEAYSDGTSVIKVQYTTTDIQANYVGCQVGGLISTDINKNGCFTENGTLTIDGTEYSYTYDPNTDNNNGRTISGFSTEAREKLRVGCKGRIGEDFMINIFIFHDE